MARFDVYAARDGVGLLLDCQTDYLAGLTTRLTTPLFPRAVVRLPVDRLNPVLPFDDREMVMMTQYMAAVERQALGPWVGSLSAYQDTIKAAIVLLLDGF